MGHLLEMAWGLEVNVSDKGSPLVGGLSSSDARCSGIGPSFVDDRWLSEVNASDKGSSLGDGLSLPDARCSVSW